MHMCEIVRKPQSILWQTKRSRCGVPYREGNVLCIHFHLHTFFFFRKIKYWIFSSSSALFFITFTFILCVFFFFACSRNIFHRHTTCTELHFYFSFFIFVHGKNFTQYNFLCLFCFNPLLFFSVKHLSIFFFNYKTNSNSEKKHLELYPVHNKKNNK